MGATAHRPMCVCAGCAVWRDAELMVGESRAGRVEFETAGLYDPDAPGATNRLALLEWLVEEGATLGQLVEADAVDGLVTLAAKLAWHAGEGLTLGELAAQAGLAPEQVEQLRTVVGLAPLDPNDPRFIADDVAAFSAFNMGAAFFGEAATLHFGRVLGNAVARIAEASMSLFARTVEGPLRAQGANELALAQAYLDATRLLDIVPGLMTRVFQAHVDQAMHRPHPWQGDSARLAVGFVDIAGFTPLSGRLSAAELVELVTDFEGRAVEVVAPRDGRVVKLIGDEVMFTAPDAACGCDIALALCAAFQALPLAVQPRGGIAIGDMLAWGGDIYGPTVNMAARIADLALPFEILVDTDVRDEAVKQTPDLSFEPAGRRHLKGFDQPATLWSTARA